MSRFDAKECNGHFKCQCKGFTPGKWNAHKCSSCFHGKVSHKSSRQQTKVLTASQKSNISKPTKPHVATMKTKHCTQLNCKCQGFAPNKWKPNKCASCFHWKTHHNCIGNENNVNVPQPIKTSSKPHNVLQQSHTPTANAQPIRVTSQYDEMKNQSKSRPEVVIGRSTRAVSVAAMKHNIENNGNYHREHVQNENVVTRGTRSVSVSALKHKLFSADNKKKIERSFKGMGHSALITKKCEICFEVKTNIVTTYECKHNLCKDCMQGYIYSKKNKLKIKCPAFKCTSLLSQYYDIKSALSNKEYVDLYLSTKCLSDGCNNTFQIMGRSSSKIYCNQCGNTWCIACKVPWHEGKECDECIIYREAVSTSRVSGSDPNNLNRIKQAAALSKEEEQKSAFYSVLMNCGTKTIGSVSGVPEIRLCPECGTLITHTEACKHMHCTQCETSFCFVCLALYDVQKGWPCGSYSAVCPIAPIQTEKPKEEENVRNLSDPKQAKTAFSMYKPTLFASGRFPNSNRQRSRAYTYSYNEGY